MIDCVQEGRRYREEHAGLRIRESFKPAPGLRMTISNSGVSYSAVIQGAEWLQRFNSRRWNTVKLSCRGVDRAR
ncbi:MAG: DUF4236 domain-containing protein [Pseudonocardiales bacterium]|nr:DUF4236 domain-containing protein [Pseudonocardiales bacterium]MBV9648719.1 DUF4236 domain-containing protein [Pseudonocardiales bacterium]